MDSKVGTWSWGDGSISKVFSQTRGPEFEPPYRHITQNKTKSSHRDVGVHLQNQRQEDPWSSLDSPSGRTCELQVCGRICLKTNK